MNGVGVPALPVLEAPLTWMDGHYCSLRYGIGILPADCHVAGFDLPQGNEPVTYNGINHDPAYTLPWSKTIGEQFPHPVTDEGSIDISHRYLPAAR